MEKGCHSPNAVEFRITNIAITEIGYPYLLVRILSGDESQCFGVFNAENAKSSLS